MKLSSESGTSLIGALMGLLVLSFLAMGLSQFGKNSLNIQAKSVLSADQSAIKIMLEQRLDCTMTMAPYTAAGVTTCPAAGALIELKDRSGNVIVSSTNPGTSIGKWRLRAGCLDTGSSPGLWIQAARPKGTAADPLFNATASDFEADPINGKALTWTRQGGELFPTNARPCSGKFGSTASTCVAGGYPCAYSGPSVTVVTASLMRDPSGNGCSPSMYPVLNATSVPIKYPVKDMRGAVTGYWELWESSQNIYHFYGTAFCPSGYHAVGGGARCQVSSSGSGPGIMMENYPTHVNGGYPNGWFSDCCIPSSAISFANTVYAVCEKDKS